MRRSHSFWRLLAALLLIVAAPAAWSQSCSGGQVTLTMPDATVPKGAGIGTPVGSAVNAQASFSCSGLPSGTPKNRFAIQIFNLKASQLYPATLPSATSTNITTVTFKTNVPGIGLQLTMSPAMRGYDVNQGDQQGGAYVIGYINGSSGSLTVNYTAQFVVIGTVSAGTTTKSSLLNYEWYIYGYNNSASLSTTFDIAAGTKIALPSCSVDPSTQNFAVQLRSIGKQELSGNKSTAGTTPFSILLNCSAGLNVKIQFDPQTGSIAGMPVGTLPPSSANQANNVLIQLLDSTGKQLPISTPFALGTATGGNMPLNFFAQYYANSGNGNLGVGLVQAVATFTITYN